MNTQRKTSSLSESSKQKQTNRKPAVLLLSEEGDIYTKNARG
jgi:hypothetical protein